jgi:hypothetical protein
MWDATPSISAPLLRWLFAPVLVLAINVTILFSDFYREI